jgi:hypothetical protein
MTTLCRANKPRKPEIFDIPIRAARHRWADFGMAALEVVTCKN